MLRSPIALAASVVLAAALAPPSRAEELSPGEETVFSVSYLGVPTGEARIRVGRAEGDLWPVIFQARTAGAASLFDIREHLVTYWDALRRASRGSDLQAYEVGDFHADSARFDQDSRTVIVVEQRRGRTPRRTVLKVPEGALDLAGAFCWLRLQKLGVGTRFELPVVAGTTQFTLVAEVLGNEAVRTPLGQIPSLKIRVRTAFEGKFSTRRDSYLWLADEPGHRLVRAAAEFAVGAVVGELKSYHPGGQVVAAH
ncbi:MAG TPA: DUF3108 domain-containing protein [Anaeromyxobacter sp.]|nr:DUF3108 domain-containing protein [Anaeromyxobacter sp.]